MDELEFENNSYSCWDSGQLVIRGMPLVFPLWVLGIFFTVWRFGVGIFLSDQRRTVDSYASGRRCAGRVVLSFLLFLEDEKIFLFQKAWVCPFIDLFRRLAFFDHPDPSPIGDSFEHGIL